jgi:MOSC domain-containing protein YiiM
MQGRVEAINIAERAGEQTSPVDEVRAVAGRGLDGDRIFNAAAEADCDVDAKRQVTLIEAEALEAIRGELGIELSAGGSRRNICTRGVALNHLVDREFLVGAARLRGIELCEPCGTLEKLTATPGLVSALLHRGGLRAEVLESGTIRVGDTVSG